MNVGHELARLCALILNYDSLNFGVQFCIEYKTLFWNFFAKEICTTKSSFTSIFFLFKVFMHEVWKYFSKELYGGVGNWKENKCSGWNFWAQLYIVD